jgi:hypothetical protein
VAARANACAFHLVLTGNPHEQRLSGKRSRTVRGAVRRTRRACVDQGAAIALTTPASDATRDTRDVSLVITTRAMVSCIDVFDRARE